MRARHGLVHVLHHRLVLLRSGDGEHAGMGGEDAIRLDPEAAGDDDLAVLRQRLADGRKRLSLALLTASASDAEDIEVAWRKPLIGAQRRSVWHVLRGETIEAACRKVAAKGML